MRERCSGGNNSARHDVNQYGALACVTPIGSEDKEQRMSAITSGIWAFAAGALIPMTATLNAGLARESGGIAPYRYAGSVIVGFYILSITFLAPRLGVSNAILFAVTAQLITSAFIDHFAVAGATLRPLTTMQAIGLYRCCWRNHHAGQ
jgi:uncharacterized membrane protein YdcZ (DUF606 family)